MTTETSFCGLLIKNRLVLASGILGTNYDILRETFDMGCGLVSMKSIGPKSRDGHKNPTVLDYGHGLINAVGLPTPGYSDMTLFWQKLATRNFPIIASIYGSNVDEFVEISRFVSQKKPDFIELNISCPNTKKEGMIFGVDPKSSFQVVKKVKKVIGKIPLIAKLTPQALNIGEIALSCEDAGADAICAINTVGPGMVINIDAAKPILYNKTGGLSGPAIKPIAVRCIYEIYKKIKIPIIGMGGVLTGEDAIELMMAGAAMVGIGSGVYYRGKNIFQKINNEIKSWFENKPYKSIDEIIGAAHD